MQVILLERVEKLGQIGDVVKVKDGFARNFLLPQKKALRATKGNLAYFESQRVQLEARNLERKTEAETVGARLEGKSFVLLRQAGERGQLYGSVSTRDVAAVISEGGFTIDRHQIPLDHAIKTIGKNDVIVVLHPEVRVHVAVIVARTEDEAERIARGEDVLAEVTPEEEAAAEAAKAAEALFEEGAGPKKEEQPENPQKSGSAG
ncbi:MAG: 50S ribosomal protein L9 [Alphaproteobacteria bacterium]